MKRIISEPIKIQSKDGRIVGLYLPDGKVKIFSGSFFRNVEVNSIRQNIRNKRLYLLNNNYISNHQLVKEYIFENPSIAISTLMGHMETGNQAFVTLDNIELGDYLRIDEIDAFEQKNSFDIIEKIDKQNTSVRELLNEEDSQGFVSTNDLDETENLYAEYSPSARPEKLIGENVSFKRNSEKAKKCIVLANYSCNLDITHNSFIAKNGKTYMEAHHLVPLFAQEFFEYSLDVDANIISLCPNCHRKLHYGDDIYNDLKKLYDDRIIYLQKSGINISFETLLELYR